MAGTTPQTNARGSNGQRVASTTSRGGGRKGKSTKNASNADAAALAELTRLREELAAAHKKIEEVSARGTGAGNDDEGENIEVLLRPRGEAGEKRGFNLQESMGLDDNDELYGYIQRLVHHNVARANLDFTVDFRQQDPAKLAAVYKLTRKDVPYLSRCRFPLDWALAEMVKQYLRNKRRYAVKCSYIPNRATRKRQRDDQGAGSSNKRARRSGVAHIDDQDNNDSDNEHDEETPEVVDGQD
ncbi:hypothetical protein R3P38DRAFT_2498204 [Favolaschia claudopus]|uniref:Uncharacterized protein n=1 Tax=Favolaschia claudopus TaxID=2862362 RepID=A0AAW0DYX5_9AGAR